MSIDCLLIEEHPNGHCPDRSPPTRMVGIVAISDLLRDADANKIKAATDALAKTDTAKLKALLHKRGQNRLSRYLINHELSIRNIPPVLRGLLESDHTEEANKIAELGDFFAIDLDWIVTRYPDQKIEFNRWQNLFTPSQFHGKAKFLFFDGKRPTWRIRSGLAISLQQETELFYIQSAAIDKKRAKIEALKSEVRDIVRQKRYERNLTITTPQEQDEVKRMIDYWEAANLCNGWGHPTRVVWFYESMTGNTSTRQKAGNIMTKLQRDLGKKAYLK